MKREMCERRGNYGKSSREGNTTHTGKEMETHGDDRQGTPPRTISALIGRIPLRKRRYCDCEVIDAANCLFSGFLLKHLYFHTKRLTRSKASGEKTRTYFSWGYSVDAQTL